MSFLKKVLGKFLTDRERVKLNQQKAKEDGTSKPARRDGSRPDKVVEDKKSSVQYQRDGNVVTPSKFLKKMSAKPLEKSEDVFDRFASKHPEKYRVKIKKMIEEEHDEPYTGVDVHNIHWRDGKEKNTEVGSPVPMKNVKDLKGTLGKDVPKGGMDPFMWVDSKYSISKDLLEKHKGRPLQINTRSDLIAHDDYIAALDSKHHKIHMHVIGDGKEESSYGDRPLRVIEPGAPSLGRRLAAARKLLDLGFDVTIVKDELEHPKMDSQIKDLLSVDDLQLKRGAGAKVKIKKNKVKLSDAALKKVEKALEHLVTKKQKKSAG